jgi:hypothetical protein
MTHYDPIYGELLTSRETADLTGFTINQLRNHRQRKTSPLPFISDGNTSWYRKKDVIKYLEIRGAVQREYFVPDGFEVDPIDASPVTEKRRNDVAQIAKITTRNAWSKWTETLTQSGVMDINEAFTFLETETQRLYLLATGEDLYELYPGKNTDFWLRTNDPLRFWPGRTYATRSLARKLYNWDVSDEDIINTPVGEVPPTKLD